MSLVPEVVCMGHANLDVIVYSTFRPRSDGDFLVKDLELHPGGSAANTAVGLARLGSEASFIGRLGKDVPGNFLHSVLSSEGVDTRPVQRDRVESTGMTIIFVSRGGEKTMFSFVGANGNISLDSWQSMYLRKVKLFHLSGYSLVEKTSGNTALALLRLAKRYAVKTVIDLGLRPTRSRSSLMRKALGLADILMANEVEASLLSGMADLFSSGTKLLRLGPEIVVVKLGKRGAASFTDKKTAFHGGFRVRPVDSTGAGDAFNAGYIFAFLQGFDFDESLAFANAVAAIKVTGKGAQTRLPRAAEVIEFMNRPGPHRSNL